MSTNENQLEYFQTRLKIDKDNLDDELADFPSMFFSVSDYYVDADRYAKRLAQRLDREKASITSALRDAAAEENEKKTETQLKQEVSLHPKIVKLSGRLRQAEKVAKKWDVLKESFVQKSFSLKGLVSLSMHENFQSSTATVEGEAGKRKKRRRN